MLFAGIERGGKPQVQLMRWGRDGAFYEASGVGEQRSGLVRAGAGPDDLAFRNAPPSDPRLHDACTRGVDFSAGYGTPILAVTDGRVARRAVRAAAAMPSG